MNKLLIMATLLDDNPYVAKINAILADVKGWLLGIVLALTVVMVVLDGLKYQHGNGQDKSEAIDNVKKHCAMGGGIFILVWIATYVVGKMSA